MEGPEQHLVKVGQIGGERVLSSSSIDIKSLTSMNSLVVGVCIAKIGNSALVQGTLARQSQS